MVILHDAIQTNHNGGFVFFLKIEQKSVSLKNKQKKTFFNPKTHGCFFKKGGFLSPDC